ncbi:fukutin-like protein [Dinothrombium tinctorium]|uniref:Fukutin-like protein n=1 Tax=Dinothrombium tinctorium TaxID=1965070 RepID=A0A443RQ16_9ACAR|nr:fukutin-like protein [Dinothrombium tinctorium]
MLCKGQKVTNLATFGHVANYLQLNKVISSLRDKGLTVIEYSDFDPTLLHLNIRVSQPLHVIVFDDKSTNGTVVHINIFYERIASKYWWKGPLYLTDFEKRILHRRGIRRPDLDEDAAIYNKVEIKLTIIDGLLLGLPTDMTPFLLSPALTRFIECNRTRAKQFYNEFGRDENDSAIAFRSKATNLLRKVKNILDYLEIPFWLSSGSCLGYYRECDWISYTQDVDIGIAIKHYKPSLIDHFSMNNLPLIHVFGKPEDSYELSFRDHDLKLDIFFFYEDENSIWNGGTQARTGFKFKYVFRKFDLCWTEFVDLSVRVPCQTKAYIEDNYGSKWYTPIKQWNWKESPANVKPNGQWPVEEWAKVIQLYPTFD